jgi:FkbM family methyltransferase
VDRGELVLMRGSPEALKYAQRELAHLDLVLELVPGRTAVVQAGGCLGVFPDHLAKRFKTAYVFEPGADLFPVMVENAPAQNIVRFQAALGFRRGLVGTSRVRRDGKPNAHEGITHVVDGGTVPTLLIDDLALPVLDLIYLDVEGGEYLALQGATETIWRCRPVIVVEMNKNLGYVGVLESEIVGFLESHGYRHALSAGSDRAFVPVERT